MEHGVEVITCWSSKTTNQPLLRATLTSHSYLTRVREDIHAVFEAPHLLDLTPQELASERSVREARGEYAWQPHTA